MSTSMYPVLTIGHSSHSLDAFTALLTEHDRSALVDVRSVPFSRYNPHFNWDALEQSLAVHEIKYVHLGRELGGRSEDRSCYEKGRLQYVRLAQTDLFRRGLDLVLRRAKEYRVALMCAEKEPLECHRTLLVGHALAERGVAVQHIMANGQLEPHETTMERLLDLLRLPHQDLFRSKAELIAEAIARQAARVAYVDES